MNLSQLEKRERYKQRRMAINEAKEEALSQMMNTINRGLSMQMEMVMLLVLHDKFGFGAERCAKALVSFEELWGDVCDQRLSLDDIEQTIKEELCLVIEESAIYKIDKDGNKVKKIWSGEDNE